MSKADKYKSIVKLVNSRIEELEEEVARLQRELHIKDRTMNVLIGHCSFDMESVFMMAEELATKEIEISEKNRRSNEE